MRIDSKDPYSVERDAGPAATRRYRALPVGGACSCKVKQGKENVPFQNTVSLCAALAVLSRERGEDEGAHAKELVVSCAAETCLREKHFLLALFY